MKNKPIPVAVHFLDSEEEKCIHRVTFSNRGCISNAERNRFIAWIHNPDNGCKGYYLEADVGDYHFRFSDKDTATRFKLTFGGAAR